MTNYREILRLSSLQYSQRTIESMAHCSRHTVRDVLQAAKEQGISWPLSDDVANADLEQLLFPDRHKVSSQYAEPDYPYIHRELARSGVTLTLLWEEYCAKCQQAGQRPYMSTQFGERYRRWARITKGTMRIQHKPGDAMQVDWAGDTIPIQDPVTGEQSAAYLFVAVLPCSYYTYAEACDDMKTENWLNCHVHAFDYCGGVARLLIPDNCKTATLSNTRYDVILNRSYQELAEHYGMLEIVEARCHKSTIFCTQYESEGWYTRIDPNPESDSPVSEAIMDRIIHNAYEVLVDGRVSMRERKGLKAAREGGGQDV